MIYILRQQVRVPSKIWSKNLACGTFVTHKFLPAANSVHKNILPALEKNLQVVCRAFDFRILFC